MPRQHNFQHVFTLYKAAHFTALPMVGCCVRYKSASKAALAASMSTL